MYAAGLTMPLHNVDAFRERFEQVVRERMPEHLRTPEEEVDLELPLDHINERFVRAVQHMAPFGPRNMRPVFATRGVVDAGSSRIVGEDHLKLSIQMPGQPGKRLDAIAFRMGRHLDMVKSGEPFSLLYVVEENEYQGRKNVQLNIKDIKAGVEKLFTSDRSVPASKASTLESIKP
jgi:single-stranded-DNA-specific exonuclease